VINPQFSVAQSSHGTAEEIDNKRIIIDVADDTVTEEVEEQHKLATPEFHEDHVFKTEEKKPLKVYHPEDIIMTEQTTPEAYQNNQLKQKIEQIQ